MKINLKLFLIIFLITPVNNNFARTMVLRDFDKDGGHLLSINKLESSSELLEKNNPKNSYEAFYAFDGQLYTAWVEGVKGPGIGEWIKIYFKDWHFYSKLNKVYRLLIVNGLAKNRNLYYANNRVKKLEIEFSEGQKRIIHLRDGVLTYQKFKFDHIEAKWMKLKILNVYKGSKYDDTCISEIELEHDDKEYIKFKK